MKNLYIEHRSLKTLATRPAIDIARHLQARQYVGSAVVVTDNPFAILSATRKQLLKVCRQLQRLRASTLNAEEILRHTKAIMHLQNMRFTMEPPEKNREAEVYFLRPSQISQLPPACYTIYVTVPLQISRTLQDSLMEKALIVSYDNAVQNPDDFQPKEQLEDTVIQHWHSLENILRHYDINPEQLSLQDTSIHVLDVALDNLIGNSSQFLTSALEFQHALDIAQPLLTIPLDIQRRFEAVSRLAYRVHTLSPSRSLHPSQLLQDSDTYFLRDSASTEDSLSDLLDCTPQRTYVSSATIKI